MKTFAKLATGMLFLVSCGGNISDKVSTLSIPDKYEQRVDSVLKLMTLDEKIGQLNQYTGNWQATGPVVEDPTKIEQIKAGKVGSMLNIKSVKHTRELQEYAMQSRLRIPLMFGLDVVHGLRTIYPIPLGEAASFDLDLMKRTAAGAAKEASAQGVHWTFAPMIDISRDARWGRVMEGAGEDTWYGCKVAQARVSGFQGDDLSDPHTIMACAKHFAAYGACIAGKDYNTVDISEQTLHEVYLPPFKAAVDAGVASFMNSFNDINGIPATGNTYIQRDLLKGSWNFNGLTVSDWGSIREMIPHGYVSDLKGAAEKAILAGCDIDMESRAYHIHLKKLVEEGTVSEGYIDDAVRRILFKKFELGLFDDPFLYCDETREKEVVLSEELKNLSREAGAKSIVLLKNDQGSLPLNNPKKIAVIGSLAKSQKDMLGFWANEGIVDEVVTVYEGLKNKYPESDIVYTDGYDLATNELHLMDARNAAMQSDVVIVAVGERFENSGEAKSRADINIHPNHQLLVKELKKTGKNVVVLLMGGRPMIFNEMTPHADAILLTWWLGTEAGNAIADVLAGDYNPSGKLPMTFPAHVGQIPIYYNYKNTGRPENKEIGYSCRYQDIDFEPAYPFGYGLSYTDFLISEPVVKDSVFSLKTPLEVCVKVKNTGKYAGKETVQLYIRDLVASLTRPVKELRGLQQVELQPGEEKEINFMLTEKELGFESACKGWTVEPGLFDVMVGNSALNVKKVRVELKQ
ncbi:glycoside hydrolase family 3 N-terminal domain-containing protein [Bacteroides difficilis]|uniref:beta-glucosidase n=1 Tax=Bacteroides difficilis TaxID=2763021 RepID=A0ABR7C9A1_9BACE|nr:glycoside hydrolase family 3 N-terminal domain-containing protein [Bacteroides difficilis]MBC5604387.1 glycoside hydrolase family 3 C-terminal domain-containing protein [Bacteroides difficilis]